MTSEESDRILEEIAEMVIPRIDGSWEWARVNGQVDDEQANFVISYLGADGETMQMEIERAIEIIPDLSDRFTRLQSVTADKTKGRWFRCEYTLHRNGNVATEFSWEPPDWVT